MAYIASQLSNTGSYISTTRIWSAGEIETINVNSDTFKRLLVDLYDSINAMSISLNQRTFGFRLTTEMLNGNLFFNPTSNQPLMLRNSFYMTVNFGALPATGSKSVAHNIDFTIVPPATSSTYTFVSIIGSGTDPINLLSIPLPYSSAVAITDNIQVDVTTTDIVVTTGGTDRSNYTRCIFVIEYLKN